MKKTTRVLLILLGWGLTGLFLWKTCPMPDHFDGRVFFWYCAYIVTGCVTLWHTVKDI